MSLNFALLVTGPAYGTQTASTAYRFALSLIEQGHQLSHLFFYMLLFLTHHLTNFQLLLLYHYEISFFHY